MLHLNIIYDHDPNAGNRKSPQFLRAFPFIILLEIGLLSGLISRHIRLSGYVIGFRVGYMIIYDHDPNKGKRKKLKSFNQIQNCFHLFSVKAVQLHSGTIHINFSVHPNVTDF